MPPAAQGEGNLYGSVSDRGLGVFVDGEVEDVGAGIVADSDPAQEDLECRNKAAALLAAVPAARRMSAARTRIDG